MERSIEKKRMMMVNRTDARPKQQGTDLEMISPNRSFTIVKHADISPTKTIYEKYNRDSNAFDENAGGLTIQLRIKALDKSNHISQTVQRKKHHSPEKNKTSYKANPSKYKLNANSSEVGFFKPQKFDQLIDKKKENRKLNN